jgi:hypothetical protein
MTQKVTKKLLKKMNWREDSERYCRDGLLAGAFTFVNSPQGHSYWWARHADRNLITEKDLAFLAECERVYQKGKGK